MNTQQDQVPQNTEELKEIPKWTRKYAQNRMLTSYVVIGIGMLAGLVIVFLSALVITALVKGKMTLAGIGIVALAAMLIIIRKCGGKYQEWIDQWIYGHEGTASMPQPELTKKNKWLGFVVAVVVFICILGTYHLSMEGYIAFKYMLPLSAIYFVPFLVHQYFQQRPRIGPLVLICPILYTIHAALIIAGVPIFFSGNWGILNLALPVFGYTFLAHAISHIYSRYALKKLKGLTHLEGGTANGN
ncbi:MAG: hypothetical protein H8E73_07540 [Planctomycetes bacterium]|nr:hypothetical protein [Planctomycetota bacterium]MBL7187354.1 hypothetical protein [Phycisphaerae bacterium]